MRHYVKLLTVLIFILVPSFAYSAESQVVQVTSVGVTGNENIASEYILNVVDT